MQENADIRELSVAAWRLEKWLDNLNSDRKMAAKSALRSIKKYIAAMGIEIKDPIGSKFDPGLAVEVVNNEDETGSDENLIIIETLSPYIYQNGELIQRARVIIGTTVKAAKTNNEVVLEPEAKEVIFEPSTDDQKVVLSDTVISTEEDIKLEKDDIERVLKYAKIL